MKNNRISPQKKSNPKGRLLDPCPKASIFKIKVWKHDGREFQRFSFDYANERDMFNNKDCLQLLKLQFNNSGPEIFEPFNGFKKLEKFINELCEQGELKFAQVYCNQIKVVNPKVSTDPVPILLCSYQDPNQAAPALQIESLTSTEAQ